MITISVASGKGGAGKTSIAAALAEMLGTSCVFADCDVDAANAAIALGAKLENREPYNAGPGFRVDEERCSDCGLCAQACRFGAIKAAQGKTGRQIVPELCERCGACLDACPSKAIVAYEKRAGELFISGTRLGFPLIHAELVPGEDTSGKLVRKVRERAELAAESESVIVVDSPPGIGCPVIASITGCDLVLLVVEASASGIRDAERLIELIASMGRKAVALINKAGLDGKMDLRARELLAKTGVPLAGEIPFDPALRSAEEKGKTWLSLDADAGIRARTALRALRGVIEGLSRRESYAITDKETP